MALWQGIALGICALALGALLAYGMSLARQRRVDEGRTRTDDALKRAVEELDAAIGTQLDRARANAEQLRGSRRLTPEERERVSAIADALQASQQRLAAVVQLAKLESSAARPAGEPFDLHALLADLVASLGRAGRIRPARIRSRIDPRVPYRLVGDAQSLRVALTALCASLARPGGSVAIGVRPAGRRGKDLLVRFELAHLAADGRADLPREDDIRMAERIAALMDGRLGSESDASRGAVLALEAPFGVQTGSPGAVRDIAGARVLVVARDEAVGTRLVQTLAGAEVRLITVPSATEAIATIGRAIRVRERVDAVMVAADGGDEGRDHRELCERGNSVQTPVYLLSRTEAMPDPSDTPFDAVVDVAAPAEIVAQAIHVGVSAQRARSASGLVQVEPWAWGAGAARPRRRILVVDDNVTNLLIVENILRSAGYDVDLARNGEEALTRLLGSSYRMAILDLHMPGMDGVTLLKRYRALRPRIKIPIAFLTANTSMDATRECAEAGADAFLTKPIVVEDLLNTVETLLKDSEVHWLPGAHGRAGDDEGAASAPPVVDRQVIRELSLIYKDDAQGVGRVLETFRAEAEWLLTGLTEAVATNDVPAFRDHAHALWASAVNVGAAALAAACRDAKTVGPVELRRDGQAMVDRLREVFADTMSAFNELQETSPI